MREKDMFSIVVVVLVLLAVLGAALWAVGTEGADERPEPLKRSTNVSMKRIKVRLDQIVMDPDRFCHRDGDALEEKSLESMMNSLIAEGMQVPIEGYFDEQGRFVLVKGHRRVRSHQLLVGKIEHGFVSDMELDAIELKDFTPQDLTVRSVGDNEVRLNLDRFGRIRAAKRLFDAAVEERRAAAALGVDPKTYRRDLLIAKHGWMFQHAIDGSIDPTGALALLEAAINAKRVNEVKEDFDAWVAEKKRQLREKERLRKLQGGKELSDAEKQVKRLLPKHLLNHWVELIKKGERFNEDAEWEFAAQLDTDNGLLRISSVNLNLSKAPPDQIAKVGSMLSNLSKKLMPILQKRLAEQGKADGEAVAVEPPWDMEYLEQIGAHDLLIRLKEKLEKAKTEQVEGEADPTHDQVEERTEEDLADQIDLPQEEEQSQEEVTDAKPPAAVPPPAPKVEETPVEKKENPPAPKSEAQPPKSKGKAKS